ncbi:MAG: Cof-type HAD-IIB family hydrolase [Treponema sp.]
MVNTESANGKAGLMPDCKAVFCDIDGTLLNSEHKITPLTLEAVRGLGGRGVRFVIVSARSPSCIFPILDEYGLSCPLICFSGALIMDEKRNIVINRGFTKSKAAKIVNFLEKSRFDLVYSIYSSEQWVTADTDNEKIKTEERIVRVKAERGDLNAIRSDVIGKIFCFCNPNETADVERRLKSTFPDCTVAFSSDEMIEIMDGGINKAAAMREFCALYAIDETKTAAFGDSFNDESMLNAAGLGFAMANAPDELKRRVTLVTDSNDCDGIANALRKMGVVYNA